MPAPVSQNSAQGFLREFNFHALARSVVQELMGDVPWPTWLEMELGSGPDPAARAFVLTVKFTVKAHRRPIQLDGLEERTGGSRLGWSFGGEVPVPEAVLQQLRDRVPDLVKHWITASLTGESERLYEVDPRIGWQSQTKVDGSQTLLPRSKLFDPREPFSRSGFPIEPGRLGASQSPPWFKPPRCPFCRREHAWPEAPMWAGGNLMWVHTGCWRVS